MELEQQPLDSHCHVLSDCHGVMCCSICGEIVDELSAKSDRDRFSSSRNGRVFSKKADITSLINDIKITDRDVIDETYKIYNRYFESMRLQKNNCRAALTVCIFVAHKRLDRAMSMSHFAKMFKAEKTVKNYEKKWKELSDEDLRLETLDYIGGIVFYIFPELEDYKQDIKRVILDISMNPTYSLKHNNCKTVVLAGIYHYIHDILNQPDTIAEYSAKVGMSSTTIKSAYNEINKMKTNV